MSEGGGSGTDAAAFTALALSSPQRWRSVRLVRTWRGRERPDAVRAWIRRPGAMRVEGLDGSLLQAGDRRTAESDSTFLMTWSGDGSAQPVVLGAPDQPCESEQPDGSQEPDDGWLPMDVRRQQAPFWQDYHWVAMLDPYELAVGVDPGTDLPSPPLVVEQMSEVDHNGRPALQAMVRTLPAYDPRCDCCALLFGEHSEARSADAGGPLVRHRDPLFVYADFHVVRVDLGTGICVFTDEVGGSRHGEGHDVVIEAVDALMPDDLFTAEAGGLLPG